MTEIPGVLSPAIGDDGEQHSLERLDATLSKVVDDMSRLEAKIAGTRSIDAIATADQFVLAEAVASVRRLALEALEASTATEKIASISRIEERLRSSCAFLDLVTLERWTPPGRHIN